MNTLRVWLPRAPDPAFEAALREGLDPCVELVLAEARPDPADFEVLVAGRPSAEDLDASPDLRLVVIPWAGLPPSTAALLHARPHLGIANIHHNAPATAEMAIGLLIAAARQILPADRRLRTGDWRIRYDPDEGLRLVGRRALVLGYGAIGRRVARILNALDMDVTAVRRTPTGIGEDGVWLAGPEALDDLLPEAEVLIVALPSTDSTRGLLDRRRLARLPHGALFVNVARGDVVDEEALYDALADGSLAGAGLDVWWRYPASEAERTGTLPATCPFHELENVVLSPHRAGHGAGTERARAAQVARTLNAAARGDDVPHLMDVARGY